jgi:glycerol-3-phosphate acyltransferase PlsY
MVLSYLIGSIPTGVIISRKIFNIDIRTQGSGNIGSTNITRVLGIKWGIIVQIFDIIKGIFPVIILGDVLGNHWGMCEESSFLNLPILEIIIGMSAVVGHIWSCFLKFKGGKGINTAIGMLIAIMPIELGTGIFTFIIIVGITGWVSLGSMIGAVMLPIVFSIRYNIFEVEIKGYLTIMYIIIGFDLLVFFAHRTNIVRLFKGTENRMEKMRFIYKLYNKNKKPKE